MMTYTFETNTSPTQEEEVLTFNVSPNPAHDYIELKEPEHIKILSAEGRQMTVNQITGNRIDVSGLTPGVYFIQVTSQGLQLKAKFLKI